MNYPVKVIDIELSNRLQEIKDLDKYEGLQVLVRLYGEPLGYFRIPLAGSSVSAETLARIISKKFYQKILSTSLQNALFHPLLAGVSSESFRQYKPHSDGLAMPFITVAVCTRNKTEDLRLCLESLKALDYKNYEVLIVDNAPSNDSTRRMVMNEYPQFRYTLEPVAGLDWARNRAIKEAAGEIIAYTDDDCIADRLWLKAIGRLFSEDNSIMAVTGLVFPYELESEAQLLFERYGGFGRGFERKWFRIDEQSGKEAARHHGGTGKFGTGANMAFRKSMFKITGLFDTALDVGTVTNGGGDLEMFFRVIKAGFSLVYEPAAIIRHRHRREYGKLKTQIANNGIGFYSFLVRSYKNYPDERKAFLSLGVWWFWYWNLRRYLMSIFLPSRFPVDLIKAELKGSVIGLFRYQKSKRADDSIRKTLSISPEASEHAEEQKNRLTLVRKDTAVRTIDISKPLYAITDVELYAKTRITVKRGAAVLGAFTIENEFRQISRSRLIQAAACELNIKLLDICEKFEEEPAWIIYKEKVKSLLLQEAAPLRKSSEMTVSLIIATLDRPDDLTRCLDSLRKLESAIRPEIVVVDNNPSSGKTKELIKQYPEVVYTTEERKGLSYARNRGFITCRGEIAIAIDDDVVVPPDWLDKITAPFRREDVMAVTGNVLPFELETGAQNLFEVYGGLGRGFNEKEIGREWFHKFRFKAVPTWELGATANAAFRSIIFGNKDIGLLEESLGAGMPTGCSEDTYLFYKILKAGYTIAYEPSAVVFHKHRSDYRSLKNQIFSYSKGHVAYHLLTYLRDKDLRGLVRIGVELPFIHLRNIIKSILGRNTYPIRFTFLEMWGNMLGPWSLYKSLRKVKKLGRSDTYKSGKGRINSSDKGDSHIIEEMMECSE